MPFATNAKQTVFRPRSNTEKCTLSSVCQEKTDVRRNLASALTGKLKTRPWYLSDLNLVLGIFSSGRDSAIWWAPISRMPICLVFCTERICIIPPCQAHGTLPIPISKISHRLEFLPMKTCPYSLCRSWNLFTNGQRDNFTHEPSPCLLSILHVWRPSHQHETTPLGLTTVLFQRLALTHIPA